LAYLEAKKYPFTIVKYLDEELTAEDLRAIIQKSGKRAFDFVRTQEKDYKEHYKDQELSDDEWIEVLVKNKRLLARPIVINGDRAIHAVPPERVEEIL